MPTESQIIAIAVRLSQKKTDKKIAELQRQIDELKEIISKLKPAEEKNTVESLINCRRCGRKGHWTLGCRAKTDIHGIDLEEDDECYRCQKPGHNADNCHAKKDVYGFQLEDCSEDESE